MGTGGQKPPGMGTWLCESRSSMDGAACARALLRKICCLWEKVKKMVIIELLQRAEFGWRGGLCFLPPSLA